MATTTEPADARALIDFWHAAGPERWFAKDAAFDAECRERFLELHLRAARRELDDWMATAPGALALVLLLDQLPRNAYRGTAHMYATDPLARAFTARALESGFDDAVHADLRRFFYLPFMHSEDAADQQRSVELSAGLDDATAHHAREHRDIIARFGRFPHRNTLLGRETTAAERAFLDAGGFAG